MPLFDLALQNLLSPMVLFFALGLVSALIRSDLYIYSDSEYFQKSLAFSGF
jgi:hypothetical protein